MKKYCLIGWPLKHSLSAEIHNTAFRMLAIDAIYEKKEINPANFEEEIKEVKDNYSGFNITIPYKSRIIPFLTDLDIKAKNVGAVNTACRIKGKWKGYNTDIDGFIAPLLRLNRRFKKCFIMGSGGAARAVIYALIRYLSPEVIWMGVIEFDQSEKLKSDFQQYACEKNISIEIYPVEKMNDKISEADLIINATPVGTFPEINQIPLTGIKNITANTVVYDLVYNPSKTRLLREVEMASASCKTINGLEMLVGQAAAAFKLWTNQNMPQAEIITHLQDVLNPKKI
jgi:shikimate dehydrogenase